MTVKNGQCSSTGVTNDLNGIWGSAGQGVFAVGDRGTVIRCVGDTCSVMDTPTDNLLFDVWGISTDNVYAVGGRGTVIHYNGKKWDIIDTGIKGHFVGIWGNSKSDIFLVGDRGVKPIMTVKIGKKWNPIPKKL